MSAERSGQFTDAPFGAPSIEDVLALLPIVADRDWHISPYGGAIRDRDGRCPVCALANEIAGTAEQEFYWRVSGALGISPVGTAIDLIAIAADTPQDKNRAALLSALGLTQMSSGNQPQREDE